MERKQFKRITRPARLTAEEAARDEALRKKIKAEFPPTAVQPQNGVLSDALRVAINGSSKSVYQICQDAGISQIVVSRFLSGERDIRLATADRLARALGIAVTTR